MAQSISKILQSNFLKIVLYFIYSALWIVIFPFVSIRLLWKSRKDPDYRKRILERLAIFKYKGNHSGIWFHAVSLGEAIAAIPLISAISKKYPELPITVTTTTPSGSERVVKALGDKVFHVYIPYDIPILIRHFVKKIKPKILVCMETEIWPNLTRISSQQNIPIIICNGRLSKNSARKYANFFIFTQYFFRDLRVLAISKYDARRFMALGVKSNNIVVTGSIKYDLRLPEDFQQRRQKIEKYFNDVEIFLASSTHNNEEEVILNIFCKLKQKHPKLVLFLVPRHPTRAHQLQDLAKKMKINSVLRTELGHISGNFDVIIGNTIGELLTFYSFAKVVFIGGSLIKRGGHNPLEAAIFGKAIITGKYVFNFTKIYNVLQKNKACIISEEEELIDHIEDVLSNDNSRMELERNSKKVFEENGGALNVQIDYIQKFL